MICTIKQNGFLKLAVSIGLSLWMTYSAGVSAQSLSPQELHVIYRQGLHDINHKHYDRAIDDFIKIINQQPENLAAHNQLARVYAYQHRWDQAIDELKIADSIQPNTPSILLNLGTCYVNNEQPRSAESVLARLQPLDTKRAEQLSRQIRPETALDSPRRVSRAYHVRRYPSRYHTRHHRVLHRAYRTVPVRFAHYPVHAATLHHAAVMPKPQQTAQHAPAPTLTPKPAAASLSHRHLPGMTRQRSVPLRQPLPVQPHKINYLGIILIALLSALALVALIPLTFFTYQRRTRAPYINYLFRMLLEKQSLPFIINYLESLTEIPPAVKTEIVIAGVRQAITVVTDSPETLFDRAIIIHEVIRDLIPASDPFHHSAWAQRAIKLMSLEQAINGNLLPLSSTADYDVSGVECIYFMQSDIPIQSVITYKSITEGATHTAHPFEKSFSHDFLTHLAQFKNVILGNPQKIGVGTFIISNEGIYLNFGLNLLSYSYAELREISSTADTLTIRRKNDYPYTLTIPDAWYVHALINVMQRQRPAGSSPVQAAPARQKSAKEAQLATRRREESA